MKTARCAVLLSLLVALPGGLAGLAPLAASPLPKGEAVRLDASPDCQEETPAVAALPGGHFVAVWTAGTDPLDPDAATIVGRIFDSAGQPLGPELQVSQSGRTLELPSVAVNGQGRFLVAWSDSSATRIRYRLFEPSGAAAGPERTLANAAGKSAVTSWQGGGFAVLWTDIGPSLRLIANDGLPVGDEVLIESYFSFTGVSPRAVDPTIAAQGDGDLVVAWTVQNSSGLLFSRLAGKIIPVFAVDEDERDRWTDLDLELQGGQGWISGTTAAVDGLDNIVVAWKEDFGLGGSPIGINAKRLDSQGQTVGTLRQADAGIWTRLGAPKIAAGQNGDFVLVWHGVYGSGPVGAVPSSIYGRSFNGQGEAASAAVVIAAPAGHGRANPAVALSPGSAEAEAFVVWQEAEARVQPPVPGCFSAGIGGRPILTGCVPGAGRLCVGDGRFQLLAAYSTPRNGSGAGQGVRVTRDTGYFWFFDPSNVELMVKVLDGRAVNGKFWVFYGSLSNVAWNLKVTDLLTGAGKTYQNPANQLASRGDTAALPGALAGGGSSGAIAESFEVRAFDSVALDREALPAGSATAADAVPIDPASPLVVATAPIDGLLGPCSIFPITTPLPTRPGLCLNGQRFEVEVTWRDPFNGGSGVGQGVGLTEDSGYFWFFDPSNVELVVKVLDGRAVNGKFWVFYGALTNVEYDIQVHPYDTEAVRTYHNPPFQFRSVADTGAFDSNGN
ncbi:MAG TPA: hypothetical protein VHU81_05535 [Thermoanaerobaculia bacterium]|nr:hypothetical protein [Thermoanaerobaculia bacterium]